MKLIRTHTPMPKPKRKPRKTAFDTDKDFQQLKDVILNGKMKPGQQVALLFDQADAQKLHLKAPWRAAMDLIKRALREHGLEDDYRVVKYKTDSGGWCVKVTYEPEQRAEHGRQKARA